MSTKIDYVDESWNPVIGCTKIAEGCKNCYAEKMACRLAHMGQYKYQAVCCYGGVMHISSNVQWRVWNGEIYCDESALEKPLHWRRPARILVLSMGDLFHEKVLFEFIDKVFAVISLCPNHTFFVLTKRPKRMLEYFTQDIGYGFNRDSFVEGQAHKILAEKYKQSSDEYEQHAVHFPISNIFLGTSISTQEDADKNIPELLKIPGKKWVSIEPMIEGVRIRETLYRGRWYKRDTPPPPRPDWIVVGCESGPKRRPCKLEWIRSIVEQCSAANVPCYVKQIPINGKVSHNPEEWPEYLRVREYPK